MKTTTIDDIREKFANREMGKLDLREFLKEHGPFQEVTSGDWRQHQYIQRLRGIGKHEVRYLKSEGLVLEDPTTIGKHSELSRLDRRLEKAETNAREAREEVARIRREIASVKAR